MEIDVEFSEEQYHKLIELANEQAKYRIEGCENNIDFLIIHIDPNDKVHGFLECSNHTSSWREVEHVLMIPLGYL